MSNVSEETCGEIVEGHHNQQKRQQWTGFKIVGDNVDKDVRPSFQRIDYKTHSLHYFHAYAVLDRIDLSNLSDSPPLKEIAASTFLSSPQDKSELTSNFEVLVSRYVIVTYTIVFI